MRMDCGHGLMEIYMIEGNSTLGILTIQARLCRVDSLCFSKDPQGLLLWMPAMSPYYPILSLSSCVFGSIGYTPVFLICNICFRTSLLLAESTTAIISQTSPLAGSPKRRIPPRKGERSDIAGTGTRRGTPTGSANEPRLPSYSCFAR
ncbi:hypothetical protein BO70DRAFT_38720 [Aspergillus heteromorphus CBS 117.55]|uniref:Uncharacterized protein n=1 Tax=Aspergillus heteromorphus CBS 117.55 TaxID=1448321 RepID=A0A317W612_9EURO|nr:uncharacterized protein BO70DRAFT_38720 [Aspergillus heteromorphus CBS 117.55]PWY81783.1 hypothetical protein BO70DRAFT_38720 [Aspergillus heteromorphus CBS 117.55]